MNTDVYEVDSIRAGVDAVRFIGRYVRLRKVGAQYVGLCPFHKERTPSFYVHPSKKLYKCHGCGVGGDLFTFVEAIEGVDFGRAKEILANEAGVVLSKWTPDQRREHARQARQAESEARHFLSWRRATIEKLRNQHGAWFSLYHDARRFIRDYGLDCEGGEEAADT